jgi:hypothetical protein
LYPNELVSLLSVSTFVGHATTQRLHPLHLSVFMVTAPFIFAILF